LYVKSPDLAEIDRGIVSVQRMFPSILRREVCGGTRLTATDQWSIREPI
jgi:hypothetical protein